MCSRTVEYKEYCLNDYFVTGDYRVYRYIDDEIVNANRFDSAIYFWFDSFA